MSIRAILDSSALLDILTDEEKIELAAASSLRSAARGEPIWLSGAEASFVGLVHEGFVKMVQSTPTGADMTMEVMGPSQIFGLLGMVEGGGCPLAAYAMTDTAYLRIPKRTFLPIYERNSALKDRLIRKTVLRFHQKLDFMGKLFSGRSEERVAAILYILCESYGEETEDGAGIRLTVPLTRQAIGEMAGTTTETTIRILSKWAKEKVVATEDHRILIMDPDRLWQKLH